MGYKDEIYTFNGTIPDKKLKMQMEHYFPCGQKKKFGDELCDFFFFEIVKNAMNQFFHDIKVQEFLKNLKETGKDFFTYYFQFSTSHENKKYYNIVFDFNHEDVDTIFPIIMSVDSEQQIAVIDQN